MRLGVLVIGSLYWDKCSPRPEWRNSRLDCQHLQRVKVPIRYGRRSASRGDSYTMVISPSLCEEQFGTAIVLPCHGTDLVEEAEYLWAAESLFRESRSGRISASTGWGCVAFLQNPDSPPVGELRAQWSLRVSQERKYPKLDSVGEEAAVVDESGVLQIRWPRTENGSPLYMDALLATATSPTPVAGRYPLATEIADAWDTSAPWEEVSYFWKNREHCICTHQDEDIAARLGELRLTPEEIAARLRHP